MLSGRLGSALRIGIHNSYQRCIQRLVQYAQVVASEHTRADNGDSNLVQNLTYHARLTGSRALSWIIQVSHGNNLFEPQQLKDFAQKVEEVARKFPGEVVRIRHSFSRDWDGDPAIYFRVVLANEAGQRHRLSELTHRIEDALIKDLALYQSEYSVYIPHFDFRARSEQERSKDPKWE